MNVKYYTGRTVSDILIDALAKTKTNEEFMIVRGIMDRFAASDTEIVNCEYCEHYNGGCCTRFGKMAHPARNSNDFCSRGNRRDGLQRRLLHREEGRK